MAQLLEFEEEVPPPEAGFVARERMHVPQMPGPSERQRGISLCSREKREAEIVARLRGQAQAAAQRVEEAKAVEMEIDRQLEEGLINEDGTPAPNKRKRPGPGRPPNSDKTPGSGGGGEGEGDADGSEKKPKAKKAKGDDEGAGSTSKGEGKASGKKAAKEAAAAAAASGGDGAKAKKSASKKGGASQAAFFEANAVVEVSLRLGEAFANWYEAVLLEAGKAGKWKVQLRRAGDDGNPEPLRLQGRPPLETATVPQLRPLPPEKLDWLPTVGEFCELFFDDGWWKVTVNAHNEDGMGGWTVVYAPAQAVHTVPRGRLRPIFTWEAESQQYAPIKAGRGNR